MLRSRLIPSLLIDDGALVKTRRFTEPKYVGDPINAIKIFNEKKADELVVFDIGASRDGTNPNFDLIRDFAEECKMPLCYGGGIKSYADASRIIALGVEKVAVGSLIFEDKGVIKEIIEAIGSQSLVCVIDVKKNKLFGGYDAYLKNGTKKQKIKLSQLLQDMINLGVGEIIINNIDRDGLMTGYDLKLFEFVKDRVCMPITMLGGAGCAEHIKSLVNEAVTVGAACGSWFVFKGQYRAVLISYPSEELKLEITKQLQVS